jgi:hypothetical protein
MDDKNLSMPYLENRIFTTLLHHVVVSLMLVCLVISFVQMAESASPAWDGTYLVVVSFLIGLEAMYTQRTLPSRYISSRDLFLFRAAEWIIILLLLRLLLYAMRGFDQLWRDLPLLQRNFVEVFFAGEYILVVAVVAVVWILASVFSHELKRLEADEKRLRMELDSGISEQRPEVRRNLANLVLILGGFMIFAAALVRFDLDVLWGEEPPVSGSVANVVLYFALSLVLLSLTEYSLHRVQWLLERVPVKKDLAGRWMLFALVFLAVLAGFAILLPTRFSVGLLDSLNFLLYLFSSLLTLVLSLLLLPLIWFMGLIASLLGRGPEEDPPVVAPELPDIVAAAPAQAADWVELLKSVAFWVIFLSIIGYALYHYLQQNQQLLAGLRRFPIFQVLGSLLGWLRGVALGVNRSIASGVSTGLQRLRSLRRRPEDTAAWQFINLRRLSPRERIMFYYLAMVRRGGETGYPRRQSQTPYEYSRSLADRFDEVGSEVQSLTDAFVEARYSEHDIRGERVNLVQQIWQRIRKALQRKLK